MNQQSAGANANNMSTAGTDLNYDLGGEDDLSDMITKPLQRASVYLYRTLHISSGNLEQEKSFNIIEDVIPTPKEGSAYLDMVCFEAALVSLAYVKLQLKDSSGVNEICELALHSSSRNEGETTPMSLQLKKLAEIYSQAG